MKTLILPLFFCLACVTMLHAQDTLPHFTVQNINNKNIIISWVNNHPLVKQINVQRSKDSTKGYTTILNVADPMNTQNGFADISAPTKQMFYRLFVVLDKGEFYFTEAKKPVLDTTQRRDMSRIDKLNNESNINPPSNYSGNKAKPEVFIPSIHVFTQKDGFIKVNLPDAIMKNYDLKFYDEDGEMLFELKDIKQTAFTLEKTNFYHAGWFRFELYENSILVEKSKFYLSKDF